MITNEKEEDNGKQKRERNEHKSISVVTNST